MPETASGECRPVCTCCHKNEFSQLSSPPLGCKKYIAVTFGANHWCHNCLRDPLQKYFWYHRHDAPIRTALNFGLYSGLIHAFNPYCMCEACRRKCFRRFVIWGVDRTLHYSRLVLDYAWICQDHWRESLKSKVSSLAIRFTKHFKPNLIASVDNYKEWLQDPKTLSAFGDHKPELCSAPACRFVVAATEHFEAAQPVQDLAIRPQWPFTNQLAEEWSIGYDVPTMWSNKVYHKQWWDNTRLILAIGLGIGAGYYLFFSRFTYPRKKLVFLAADFYDRTQHANNTAIAHGAGDVRADKTLHLALNTIVKDEKDTFTRLALRELVATMTQQANSGINGNDVRVEIDWYTTGEKDYSPPWYVLWPKKFKKKFWHFYGLGMDHMFPPGPPPTFPPLEAGTQVDVPREQGVQADAATIDAAPAPPLPPPPAAQPAAAAPDNPARVDRQGRPVRDAGSGQGPSANRRRNRAITNAAARGQELPPLLPRQAQNRRQAGLSTNPADTVYGQVPWAMNNDPPVGFEGAAQDTLEASIILQVEVQNAVQQLRSLLHGQQEQERPQGVPTAFVGRHQRLSDTDDWRDTAITEV